jgi:hypothetical protein
MPNTDKSLAILEHEINFIARQMRKIEGQNSDEFNAIDEINMALNSARQALADYKLSLAPAAEEIPLEVPEPDRDEMPQAA